MHSFMSVQNNECSSENRQFRIDAIGLEPFGHETCRRDLSTSSSQVAQIEPLRTERLMASSGNLRFLAVGNEIYRRGWMSGRTIDPAGINLMLSPEHVKTVDSYLSDVREAVEMVRAGKQDESGREVRYT
jgi:hypothetical protein